MITFGSIIFLAYLYLLASYVVPEAKSRHRSRNLGSFLLFLLDPHPCDRYRWIQSCRHGAFFQPAPREARTLSSS
jgi:hypothetical protein